MTARTDNGDEWVIEGGGIEVTTDTGWHELRHVGVYLTRADLLAMLAALPVLEPSNPGKHSELYLSQGQIRLACVAVKAALGKARRARSKSTFVPEEGRRHAGDDRVDKYERLLDTLQAYIEEDA